MKYSYWAAGGLHKVLSLSLPLHPLISSMPIKQAILTSNHIHYICNLDMYPSSISNPVLSSYESKEVNFTLVLKV